MSTQMTQKCNEKTHSHVDQEAMRLLTFLTNYTKQNDQNNNTAASVDKEALRILNSLNLFSVASSASTIHLPSFTSLIRIDTSGKDAMDSYSILEVVPHGISGLNGKDGSNGNNANDIKLELTVKDERIVAKWNGGSGFLKLGETSNSIFLRAVGGKGGNGSNGGKGGIGKDGANGKNARRFIDGTDGEPGQKGGIGGNGGRGGNGGNGGRISVIVSSENSDLLMLLNAPETVGGSKGKGGSKGLGGFGGKGGKGGSDISWTQMGYIGNQSTTTYYTNSGGHNGPQGQKGGDGKIGELGTQGKDGSFAMVVDNNFYSTRYDFVMTTSKIIDLTTGNPIEFFEPGELALLKATVVNMGGMPSPSQAIEFSIQDTHWIKPQTSSITLNKQLAVKESYSFLTPFSFRIKEHDSISEEPLHQQEALSYRALALRVNKYFSSISNKKDFFSVRYPVQIAPLQRKIDLFDENLSTLSITIENISSIVMGKEGLQKRKILMSIEATENNDVELKKTDNYEDGISLLELNPHRATFEVNQIPPKSSKSIKIPLLNCLSKVRIIVSLYLNSFALKDHLRCIQRRVMPI